MDGEDFGPFSFKFKEQCLSSYIEMQAGEQCKLSKGICLSAFPEMKVGELCEEYATPDEIEQ